MALHNVSMYFNIISYCADDTNVSISETRIRLYKVYAKGFPNNYYNRLLLNIDNTKVLPYKYANSINDISINSTEIYLVSSYTCIGVILDTNLNFVKHIKNYY